MRNALKFTDSGFIEIKLSYCRKSGVLHGEVRDSGCGIAQEDLVKLFSRFGKLARTADINHEGIGLGLTIVKQIVEQFGGGVQVHSDGSGQGSTFSFSMKIRMATIAV